MLVSEPKKILLKIKYQIYENWIENERHIRIPHNVMELLDYLVDLSF